MANYYSNQYQQAYVDKPSTKIKPGDVSGDVKLLYFDFTVPSSAPSNGDKFYLGKLPKGARVVDALLQFNDLGGAGTVNVGIDAGDDSLETADADSFLVSVDVHTAADSVSMKEQMAGGGANAGFLKELLDNVNVILEATTAWDATSGSVKGYISYVTV